MSSEGNAKQFNSGAQALNEALSGLGLNHRICLYLDSDGEVAVGLPPEAASYLARILEWARDERDTGSGRSVFRFTCENCNAADASPEDWEGMQLCEPCILEAEGRMVDPVIHEEDHDGCCGVEK